MLRKHYIHYIDVYPRVVYEIFVYLTLNYKNVKWLFLCFPVKCFQIYQHNVSKLKLVSDTKRPTKSRGTRTK